MTDDIPKPKKNKKNYETMSEQKLLQVLLDKVSYIEGLIEHERKWRAIFNRKINALTRQAYVDDFIELSETSARFATHRFQMASQNEEDGMVLAILRAAGVKSKTFIDIGCGSNGGNSGLLAGEFGWRGMLVDSSERAIAACTERFRHNPRLNMRQEWVTPDNINALISAAGLAGEVDFFSLDIDSYDFWVFKELSAINPRVISLEYNALLGNEKALTVPLGAQLGTLKGYHGASLLALNKLASHKGYRLVAVEPAGVNAFFIRNDLCPEILAIDVSNAFRPIRDRFSDESRPNRDIEALAKEAGLDWVEV